MTLYYPPTKNGLQKELDVQLDQAYTTSMTLNNVTGVQDKAGVVLLNRVDSGGTELSPSVREWVSFTGVSGNTLTGLGRALGGSTDQDHAVGSVVEFIMDITWAQGILDELAKKTGVDANYVSGTSGGNGQLLAWNGDGDAVDAGYGVLDEDNLVSDHASVVATQQSIKAYSDTYQKRFFYLKVIKFDESLATGNGQMKFTVPDYLTGANLIDADASIYTTSSSGLPTIQIHNLTDTADMLSTEITIDTTELNSYTATTPPVINAATDDVVTGDILQIDVDVAGTGTTGLDVILVFQIP